MIARLLKLLVFLTVLGGIGLIGYAYLGAYFGANFAPPVQEIRVPVTLDAQGDES